MTNKSSRGNQHICIVHPYTCLLSTSLAVLVNGSKHITDILRLTRKASVGMYYTYVLITPTTLVCHCLLFSTAIPTSLFIKQLFFILYIIISHCQIVYTCVEIVYI